MKQLKLIEYGGYLLSFFIGISLYAQIENAPKSPPAAEIKQESALVPEATQKATVSDQKTEASRVVSETEKKGAAEPQVPAIQTTGLTSEITKPSTIAIVPPTTIDVQKKIDEEKAAETMPTPPPVESEQKIEQAAKVEAQQEEKKPEKPPAIEEEGIDTLDQDGGNWLLKRQALEKTMDVIEKIKDIFTKILESRIEYLVKRNKADRSFDLFANTIGFELGDLNQFLTTIVTKLKEERKKDGDLTEEERQVLTEVESKIAELKSLRSTIKSITDMDASLDDAIIQLEKEINTSNSYQTRAWRNFQTIKKVLSDEKAEELYLQTESLLKNMQDIYAYLRGDLLTYFNSIINNLKQDMSKAEEAIKTLQTKGINLKDEVKKIRKAEKLARKKKLGIVEKAKETQEKEVVKKPEVKKGWFDSIWDYLTSFFVSKEIVVRKPIEAERVEEQESKEVKESKNK